MPLAALFVVQGLDAVSLAASIARFNAARGFVGGASVQQSLFQEEVRCFNAARGFVGGASLLETTPMQ